MNSATQKGIMRVRGVGELRVKNVKGFTVHHVHLLLVGFSGYGAMGSYEVVILLAYFLETLESAG